MSKITCDICGTTYAQTAPCCPICGNSRNSDIDAQMENLIPNEEEEISFSGRKREIFDFDEVNSEVYEDDYHTCEESDGEEPSGQNTFLIIALTVLIALMLIAAGYIFVRFYLPNMGGEPTIPATTAAVTESVTEATTEPSIPCENLVMTSGASAILSAEGQNFLLHVQAQPGNTTDKILYTSGNEAIATVTEDGRITAVSEGDTIIYIACGKQTLECPVTVQYVADTKPPEIDITPPAPVVAEDVPQQTEPEETVPAQTTPEETTAAPTRTDVVLKLKKTDVQLGAYLQFTLELDCDLKPEEVEWSSEHPYIATVDEKGLVKSVMPGTTVITAKYGDQTAQCTVRCIKDLK